MSQFNGWSNYETWNANLWIDNDWGLSENISQHTAELFGSYEDADEITFMVADYIQDIFLDLAPDVEGFYCDMINSALIAVNWQEIARHYVNSELRLIEQESD